MSLFSLFSNCGMCCTERQENRNSQQNLSNSQASNPDRTRQLILESQKHNSLLGSGAYGDIQNSGNNAVDPVDGFIEITPIFHGPKSGSGSGSGSDGVEDDYCEIIEVDMSHRQYSSSSNRSQKETQQIYQEHVSLPIKNSKRRSDYLHGASGGGQGNNDPSYKASMRSRNSSSHSSQDGGSQTRLEKQGKRSTKAWTEEEDRLLRFYYSKHNGKWPAIANEMADRNASQCSQRWRRIKPSKIRRPWTPEEDTMVLALIKQHGKNWGLISSQMDNRSGKQVRERYINKLDPELNNNQFNEEEDRIIIDKYYKIGPKWSEIAKYLTGRSENMVKNRFYSYIKKTYAINSLQGGGGRSDTGSWYETNSSPRVTNENDKASSYASSLYNDLDPSVNSGNIESEETSSEGEQYNQFSLGPNPGQTLGLVDDKKGFNNGNMNYNNNNSNNNFNGNNNRYQDDFFKQHESMHIQQQQQNNQFYQNMPIQQQQQQQQQPQQQQSTNNNAYLQNSQSFNQQQNQQQFYMINQDNQQNQYQNQNKLGFQQNYQINQKSNQYKKIENEKAEEMFHTPRLALANNSSFFPTDMFMQQQRIQQDEVMSSSGQQSLGNNFFNASPSPLILLSPAQMKTEQFSFTSNTPGRRFMVSNSNTPYTNNPNNNLNSQSSNVHFNFNNIATTPNQKLPSSLQQTPYQNPQQQVQQHLNQNYMQQQQQNQQFQQQMSASSNQMLDSTGFNQSIFNFTAGNQLNTPSQQPMQNVKINLDDNFDSFNLSNQGSLAQNTQQNLHGTYFLPPISPGQNINEQYYQNEGSQYQQNNNNRNQYPPREELRLDISCTDTSKQGGNDQQFNNANNNQFPLATPKIDRKQLKNMIVDLESQLQLLKVQQQNMNEVESD